MLNRKCSLVRWTALTFAHTRGTGTNVWTAEGRREGELEGNEANREQQTDKARGSAVVWRHAEQLGRPRAGSSTLAAEVPREYQSIS